MESWLLIGLTALPLLTAAILGFAKARARAEQAHTLASDNCERLDGHDSKIGRLEKYSARDDQRWQDLVKRLDRIEGKVDRLGHPGR